MNTVYRDESSGTEEQGNKGPIEQKQVLHFVQDDKAFIPGEMTKLLFLGLRDVADEEADHAELDADAGEREDEGGEDGVRAGVRLQAEDEGGQSETEQDGHGDEPNDDEVERRTGVLVGRFAGKAEHRPSIQGNASQLVARGQGGRDRGTEKNKSRSFGCASG